jgi:hypothetical protein
MMASWWNRPATPGRSISEMTHLGEAIGRLRVSLMKAMSELERAPQRTKPREPKCHPGTGVTVPLIALAASILLWLFYSLTSMDPAFQGALRLVLSSMLMLGGGAR